MSNNNCLNYKQFEMSKALRLIFIIVILANLILVESSNPVSCSLAPVGSNQANKVVCHNTARTNQTVRLCQEEFTTEKNNFQIKMCLNPTNSVEEILLIKLLNKINYKQYFLKINQEFLTTTRETNYLVNTPEQLMEMLKDDIDNVTINQDGIIRYEFYVRRHKKWIILPTKEIKGHLQQILINQINLLKETHKKQLSTLKKQLEDKTKVQVLLLDKKYTQQIKDLYQEINNTFKSLRQQIQELKQNNLREAELCKSQLRALKAQTQKNINLSNSHQKRVSFLQSTNLLVQVSPYQKNSHRNLFETYVSKTNSLMIRKIGGPSDAYHNFIIAPCLNPRSVTTYTMRLVNEVRLLFGIATSKVFGQINTYYHKQSSALFLINGALYQNGGKVVLTDGVSVGSIIQMTVDTLNWTIKWTLNGAKTVTTNINLQMRNSPLYVQASLIYVGTTVEITKS